MPLDHLATLNAAGPAYIRPDSSLHQSHIPHPAGGVAEVLVEGEECGGKTKAKISDLVKLKVTELPLTLWQARRVNAGRGYDRQQAAEPRRYEHEKFEQL